MATAVRVKQTSISEAVALLVKRIEKTSETQTEAIGELWSTFHFSGEDLESLAQDGLRDKLADALHPRVSGVVSVNVKSNGHSREVLEVRVTVLEQEFYPTSRGNIAVARFTSVECEEVSEKLAYQASTLSHKAQLLAAASRLLKKHGVSEIRQLPKAVLEKFTADWSGEEL